MKKANLLKTFALAAMAMPALSLNAQSKLDKQVLMTIGDKPVTVKEFVDVYNKNNVKSEVVDKKTVDEYLDLFVNFRMKVMEATEMQLDTSAKFKSELEGYRKQLAKPYFSSEDISDDLLREAYERKKEDIRASHILIACDRHALPSDTLKAYERAMDIRKRALKGENFGDLAVKYSDDPSAKDMRVAPDAPMRKGNRGDLGYFTVFDMVYPFETGAYNTKVGDVSMPVRSDYGYHLIKVQSKTEAMGSVQAAHIFLQIAGDASAEADAAMKQKADNIYKELMDKEGKNWNEAVTQYTDDRGTVSRGGALSNFTVSRLVPEFIEACKGLEVNEISKPVRTQYGYHIIKLLGYTGVGSFDKEYKSLSSRLEKDMRSKKSEEVVLRQVRKDYDFKQSDKNVEAFLNTVDSTLLAGQYVPAANADMKATLFSIEGESVKVADFVKFIEGKQKPRKGISPLTYGYELFEAFANETVMAYADAHLEERYPDFKNLVQEYSDGILLFDLMEKEVWDKAVKDTTGLQQFYEKNSTKYMWGERVKAAVISVTRPEALPKAKALLEAGIPVDSLRAVVARDSIQHVFVRKGFYQKGDNQFVDQTEWKPGTVKEIPSTVDATTTLVFIEEKRQPEPKTLKEAKGIITSDYQIELEGKWLERLREKYPVKVDETVLDKVRKLYK